MRTHLLMASAAALAFATGAMAQNTATPAMPDATTTDSTGPDPAATATTPVPADAAAATGTNGSTASTTDASGTATAATPPASDAASAAAAPATDAASAAAAPATDAATAAAAPSAQPGVADTQSAMSTTAPVDPAKAQAADQMIAQNWSKYDKANTGQLTPLEFGTWVLAAQGNDMSTQVEKSRQSKAGNLPATKVLNATAAEFSKADTNKDQKVSQDELKVYLAG
jgi:hypothetical protein